MAPSTQQSGVQRISGFTLDTGGMRGDMPPGSNGSPLDHEHSIEIPSGPSGSEDAGSPASFTIHFTNIRGISSNLSSVEQHLSSSLPNILLLSETQVAHDASNDSFQISHYNLISRFRFKGCVCTYYNIHTPVARLMDLESPN